MTHRSIPEVLDGAVEVRRLPHEGGRVPQVEVAEKDVVALAIVVVVVIVAADELGGRAAQLRGRVGGGVPDVLVHPCNNACVPISLIQ